MPYVPYGGVYIGPHRNQPVEAPALNPLPPNKMTMETGNAGLDGYTVLSRASRFSGERSLVGPSYEDKEGPRFSEDQ